MLLASSSIDSMSPQLLLTTLNRRKGYEPSRPTIGHHDYTCKQHDTSSNNNGYVRMVDLEYHDHVDASCVSLYCHGVHDVTHTTTLLEVSTTI
jgi:acyl-ACP thioesterase